MMKTGLVFIGILFFSVASAQKIDSIYFHLYTDSLKKGVHNYINVDGKLSNGRWLPLTSKQITLSASYGKFEGNDLILPEDCTEEKVLVKASLINNPEIKKEITIWIKKLPDSGVLPGKEEILNNPTPRRSSRKS